MSPPGYLRSRGPLLLGCNRANIRIWQELSYPEAHQEGDQVKDTTGNPTGSPVGIYQLHDSLILEKRLSGESLQQIGDEFGVSRERVRQVLKHRFNTAGVPFMRQKQVREITGLSTGLITRKAKEFNLKKSGSYYAWDKDSIDKLLASRKCRVCGNPLPPRKHVFCSSKCRNKSKYKFWSLEQKANHYQLVKRWQKEHPDQTKAITRQATRKWNSVHSWKHFKCVICGNEIPYGIKRRKYCLDCLPQGMAFHLWKGERKGPFKKT